MALRTSTRLLNARLTTTAVRQQPMRMAIRAQSTLNTGEVIEDPQIGDYPNLPRYSTQTRGPYGWWDPQDKRNFGETVSTIDNIKHENRVYLYCPSLRFTKKTNCMVYGPLTFSTIALTRLLLNLVLLLVSLLVFLTLFTTTIPNVLL